MTCGYRRNWWLKLNGDRSKGSNMRKMWKEKTKTRGKRVENLISMIYEIKRKKRY